MNTPKLRDPNQIITLLVKTGCRDISNFVPIAYSTDILNRTFQYLSELPETLRVSIENLLDASEFDTEHHYFKSTHKECDVCVRTITNAIEVCFFKSLKPVMDVSLWESIMADAPKIDEVCFANQPFICEGETCQRTHSDTEMSYYRLIDNEVVEFHPEPDSEVSDGQKA